MSRYLSLCGFLFIHSDQYSYPHLVLDGIVLSICFIFMFFSLLTVVLFSIFSDLKF